MPATNEDAALSVAPSHEGAWIEIRQDQDRCGPHEVAPSHEGAWIEITAQLKALGRVCVAPSHEGAWIEICLRYACNDLDLRRPLTRGGVD